jgi:hypothetical protein
MRGHALCAGLALLVAGGGLPFFRRFGDAGLLEDDSYFFAQIAFRLGTQGSSSFDGFTTTDGYHLLWAWILAGVCRVVAWFSTDRAILLSGMLAAYFFVVFTTARRHGRDWFARFALAAPAFVHAALMESALVALLLVELVSDGLLPPLRAPDSPRWARPLTVSALLLPLARIDVTLVVAPLLAWRAVRGQRREAARAGAALLVGVALHTLALFMIDGHLVSVAAVVKTMDGFDPALNLTRNLGKSAALGAAAVLGLAGFAAWSYHTRPDPRSRSVALTAGVIATTCAAYLGFQLLFNRHVRFWYYLPFIVLAIQCALTLGVPPRPWLRLGLVAAFVVPLVTYKAVAAVRLAPEERYLRDFLAELPGRVPPTARVFVPDVAGTVAWWTGRSVFSGDGLVGPHSYVERMWQGRLQGFFAESGICFLATNFPPRRGRVSTQAAIFLPNELEVLLVPPPGLQRGASFWLYRLRAERCDPR